jgi:hypothetical protein
MMNRSRILLMAIHDYTPISICNHFNDKTYCDLGLFDLRQEVIANYLDI